MPDARSSYHTHRRLKTRKHWAKKMVKVRRRRTMIPARSFPSPSFPALPHPVFLASLAPATRRG
eukprot:3081866-Rhodomonas_salina.3